MTDLLPQHRMLIEASRIEPEIASARGYRSVTRKSELRGLGFGEFQARVPALLVPVWNVSGEIVLYQARPDEPRINKDGKAIKYETPKGAKMTLDVPPAIRAKIGDPAVPLFITEGVRKADAAVSRGLCSIALLGVWNWRGSNDAGGKVALPDWETIALNGRTTYIVFDSDVMLKPEVHSALGRLKAFLESRHANVALIYLPAGDGAVKVGLDDFLASGKTVDDLIALASPTLRPLHQDEEAGPSGSERGPALTLAKIEPWPGEVNGEELLDEMVEVIEKHIVLPDHAALTLALWVLHAHALEAFDTTPRLLFKSPVKRCGKTRGLGVARRLVLRPVLTANVTVAALFRLMEKQPTVLVDEFDRLDLDSKKEIIGIINAGWERGGVVHRCVGDPKSYEVVEFPCFGALAIAAIGSIADTIEDRSIIVSMTRKPRSQKVERLRARKSSPLDDLARKVARWAQDNVDALQKCAEPTFPDALDDRGCDKWEPLLLIADRIGGPYPERARSAAIALSGARNVEDDSIGVRLLADIRDIFAARGVDKLWSEDLCTALVATEDRPWREWRRGNPINAYALARLLKPFGIHSKDIRVGGTIAKGYRLEHFAESFSAYAPASETLHRYKPLGSGPNGQKDENTETLQVERVADGEMHPNGHLKPVNGICSGVADRNGGTESFRCLCASHRRRWRLPGGPIRCGECHPPATNAVEWIPESDTRSEDA